MKMTDKERMEYIRRIESEIGSIADYVYMDGDAHLNKGLARIEEMLTLLKNSYLDEHTYIKLRDRETGEKIYKYFEKGDIGSLCYAAAQYYAWSDCDDTYALEEIMYDGVELEYAGWQPGMLFEFFEPKSGKIVYSNEFPQWDH
jgi:hypothetical protein